MKRIVFVNFHSDWMLLRVAMVYLFKYSAAIKHNYLLEYLREHPDEYQICSFINDRGFSLLTNGPEWLIKFVNLFSSFESRITLKKNSIDFKSIPVIREASEIREDDIVFAYNVCPEQLRGLKNVKGYKVLSLLHFHGRADESKAIKDAGINCIINEVDLRKTSEIYNKYYDLDIPWIIHPFVPAERFRNIKPFAERQNKCFSTGTITYKTHPEFLSVYGAPCDQPARKFVKDSPEFFKDTVDCYSSDYLEDNPGKQIKESDCGIVKLYKKVYNRTHIGKQKKYFSFDMVEKFNDYKMHIVGEEILGVPGIGFVEGMACGSAYIGIDSPMYRDLGLIPGVHYIAYDGTKEGLKATVEYYQKQENQEELARIATTGCRYVQEHFNGETVAKELLEKITQLSKKI